MIVSKDTICIHENVKGQSSLGKKVLRTYHIYKKNMLRTYHLYKKRHTIHNPHTVNKKYQISKKGCNNKKRGLTSFRGC